MNKTERYIIYAIIAISLTFSIISLCNSLPRNNEIDYIGVIVGILSLLVTILIGWNIYTVVDFNRKNNSMRRKVQEATNILNAEINHIIRGYAAFLSAQHQVVQGHISFAVEGYMTAIEESLQSRETEPAKLSINGLLDLLLQSHNRMIVFHFDKDQKERYISILYKLKVSKEYQDYEIDKLLDAFFCVQ